MDSVQDWTREYFLSNQEKCLQRLNSLSAQDKTALRKNLQVNENGKLCLLSNMMCMDVCEPEYYCATYKVKSGDGSLRTECGKYLDKLSIGDDESVEDQSHDLDLEERQIVIVANPSSMNQWVKEMYSQGSDMRSFTVNVSFYSS